MDSEFKKVSDSINRGLKGEAKAQMEALYQDMGKYLGLDLIIFACKIKNIKMLQFVLRHSELAKLKHESLYDAEQTQKKIKAFHHAMCYKDMTMVLKLYFYWRECSLSPRVDNVDTIENLHNILKEARAQSELELFYNQEMKIKVQCLIKFIEFQHSVYSRLKNNITGDTEQAIQIVLKEYENYNNIENVRLPRETSAQDEVVAITELSDDSTIAPKMFYHILYEDYYNNLDFFTALLILDNLHIIKKKCVVQNIDIYQQIECTMFYYLWRVFENWTLYVPSKPYIVEQECHINGNDKSACTKINVQVDKIDNASVIYLERQKFEECMNLLTNFITNNYDTKTYNFYDTSYLKKVPYMRDYYSLKKIVYYIDATNTDVLCVQRALMVIGEMTKCSKKSKHLSYVGKALLEAGLSVDTIQDMIDIRNHIAKASNEKLHKRIKVAADNELFCKIQKELKEMNGHFKSVAEMYEIILNKTMIQQGLYVIEERIKQWSPEAKTHMDSIYERSKRLDTENDEKYAKRSIELFAELERDTGLTQNLIIEIDDILRNRKILQNKLIKLADLSVKVGKRELPKYIVSINNIVNGNKFSDFLLTRFIQNVSSFFSDMGALEKPINSTILTSQELESAEQNIIEEDDNISKRINVVGKKANNNITFKNINHLKRLLTSVPVCSDLRDQRVKLISDLKDRIDRLASVLEYQNNPSMEELWWKYKRDLTFRLSFEMLLSDIFNIFQECDMKNLLLKSDKLLTSINLRIVLAHGNPILEVMGDVLDPYDFPNALIEKALAVIKAKPCVEALDKLFRDNIDPQIIKHGNFDKLNYEQQTWLKTFKECEEQDTYLKLILYDTSCPANVVLSTNYSRA